MKSALVPADLMAAIHDYLTTRPMREVEGLVSALRQCPEAPEVPESEGVTASERMIERNAA